MRIKAVCLEHPNAVVFLLQATTNYKQIDQVVERYVDEDTERASIVELDESNLYCTEGEGDHRVGFIVETQSFDEHGNVIGSGVDV
jgi:hypothetical protein